MDRLRNPFAASDSSISQPSSQEEIVTPNDDFLAFSSTSTPAKPYNDNSSFKPKRGKANRMDNWERFGAMNQEHQMPAYNSQRNHDRGFHDRGMRGGYRSRGSPNNFRGNPSHNQFNASSTPSPNIQHNSYPHSQRGTPRSEPGARGGGFYRGAPGFFGTPHQNSFNQFQSGGNRYHSNPNNFTRGPFRGNRSRGRGNNRNIFSYSKNKDGWSESGYFHPSMLEDPWSSLRGDKTGNNSLADASSIEDVNNAKMSDSMIPQMDDTVLQRHKDIQNETLEQSKCSLDQSNYSDSSDEDNVNIIIGETNKQDIEVSKKRGCLETPVSSRIKHQKQTNDKDLSMSDSMIPLIGDSILVQDVTMDI